MRGETEEKRDLTSRPTYFIDVEASDTSPPHYEVGKWEAYARLLKCSICHPHFNIVIPSQVDDRSCTSNGVFNTH
jgi:hypothetical protein